MRKLPEQILETLYAVYHRVNQLTGGALDVVRDTTQSFGAAHAGEAAAAMAYYALFSLFPLLLFLVSITAHFLESEQAYQTIVAVITDVIPVSQTMIRRNLREVLELRGAVGLIGLVGLLWSGMGFFTVLSHQVNRAWTDAATRNLFQRRLVALAMIVALLLLLALSLVSNALVSVLHTLGIALLTDSAALALIPRLLPWLFSFLMFLALYRWVPNTDVPWSAAAWGALIAAIAWQVAYSGIVWYLRSGLVQLELVYGSLATVVALMLWIYVSSTIVLLGAHLSAAITRR